MLKHFFESLVVKSGSDAPQVHIDDTWMDLADALQAIRIGTDVPRLVALIAHYSGYVREAALRRAAGMNDARLIPTFINRLNDWVPQVRAAAQEALRRHLTKENSAEMIALLPEFAKLRHRRRARHDEILDEVDRFLQQPEHHAKLIEGLHSLNPKLARECFRLAGLCNALSKEELAMYALQSKDIVIAMGAKNDIDALPEEARLALYRRALVSPFAPIRSTALLVLLRSTLPDKLAIATGMLFDRQSMPREIAWDWLDRHGADVASHYLPVLEDPSQSAHKLRCALWAVTKLQLQDSLPLIRRLSASPVSKVRASAILAWARLEPASAAMLADMLMNDIHTGVNKAVLGLMRHHGISLSYAQLHKLLCKPGREQVVMHLARHTNKWDWLACIFDLIQASGAPIDSWLCTQLQNWLDMDSRSYGSPTMEQAAILERQVQHGILAKLDTSPRKMLAFILKCAGIAVHLTD